MNVKWTTLVPILSVAAAALLGVACAEERDSSRPMTDGERIALSAGCSACHGANGEGGVGPAWKGLYMSEVSLDDGSVVTADDAYLALAIKDPTAQMVKGYSVMPPNSLSDADVQALVEFIKSLEK